jgi:hypothetical protein
MSTTAKPAPAIGQRLEELGGRHDGDDRPQVEQVGVAPVTSASARASRARSMRVARRGCEASDMRDGYLRGALSPRGTQRQMDVPAAFVAAGGSVQDAADLASIRPSTVKRHLVNLRARSGLTTEQLINAGV